MRNLLSIAATVDPSAFERFGEAILPAGLPSDALAEFALLARPRTVGAGATVLPEQSEDRIVFLARGATKLVAYAALGREQIVAFHFSEELASIPAPRAHAYTLVALQDCEALAFPADDFLDLAAKHPALMRTLLRSTLGSLHRSRERSIALGRKTARERVAGFLVGMAERIGAPERNRCVLQLPMSRRDIADNLGLTIETISRQLGELREEGLIETSGRSTVRLLDLAAIARSAGYLAG